MRRALMILVVLVSVVSVDAAPVPDELFNSMSFRLVGPFRGGRVTAVTGVPGEPLTYYMGSTGGGVWKTTDAGITWRNVSDAVRRLEPADQPQVMGQVDPELAEAGLVREPVGGLPPAPRVERRPGDAFGTASVGAVAVAPSDRNIVWVGTGSACPRGNISPGDGVYRSTDAGDSWRHMGLDEAGQIGRVVIHPTDPDIVYVAVLGNIFGPNPERGVYRTADGGLSWTKVLFVSSNAGAVDLAMDPTNPRVLYAATWQARRSPWDMVSGGSGSGLFKSMDGGNTWLRLHEGLPDGDLGRIAVAVSPSFPKRVWALVEHDDGGLYRSDNGGASFRLVNANRELRQRAWYYTHLEADPADANTVYALNTAMWRSEDGGASFRPVRTPHGDNHALWINPDDPRNLIEGNDGGANISFDGGRSWSVQSNQPTAEIYRVTVDDQQPYWLYGGQQDNTPVAIPSRSAGGGIDREDWYEPAGCESATVAVDPRDPDVTYGGCYGGSLSRYDRKLGVSEEVMAWPELAVGQRAADLRYRFQWNAPVRISPHDPEVIYHCSNMVHQSRNRGLSWEVISPDLTRDDEAKQGYAGGPITRDNTGVEVFGTVFAFEESPLRAGLLWAGSDDGLVHVSEDGGATWRDVTPPQMPEWGTVNAIELSAHDARRAFIAVHRYRLDDPRPYVFRTDDLGATWVSLTDGANGIPADHWVRVVREDPERRGLLYAGTEFGLEVSLDDGASWQPMQLDLPVTPITDLAVTRGDLVVATQGRSFWILDDLSPLRQLTGEAMAAEHHLFEPRDAVRWADGGGRSWGRSGGDNPPYGAIIHYLLPDGADAEDADEVVLEILDADGQVLRTMSSTTPEKRAPSIWRKLFPELAEPAVLDARPGANRWVWDLRLPDAELVDDAVLWGSAAGPRVPPGRYQARLTVGGWSEIAGFDVVGDPRVPADPEAAALRFQLAREIWSELTRSHRLVARAQALREQVAEWAGRTDDEAVVSLADEAKAALDRIEGRLRQTKLISSQDVLNFPPQLDNELAHLLGVVDSTLGLPTDGSVARFAELSEELDGLSSELDEVVSTQIADLEARLAELGIARIDTKRCIMNGDYH